MPNAKLKCAHCKDHFLRDSMVRTPSGNFCSINHAIAYAQKKVQKARERKREKEAKLARKRHIARKEALKTAGDYIKEAQAAVNRYVRIRDYGKACISCGKMPSQKFGGTMDAGHYKSRGSASHLRFCLLNIHAQCVNCNRYKSGNTIDYRENLIKKIGLERVSILENDKKPRKFTIDYLKRLKKIFGKRARIREKLLQKKI